MGTRLLLQDLGAQSSSINGKFSTKQLKPFFRKSHVIPFKKRRKRGRADKIFLESFPALASYKGITKSAIDGHIAPVFVMKMTADEGLGAEGRFYRVAGALRKGPVWPHPDPLPQLTRTRIGQRHNYIHSHRVAMTVTFRS